MLFKVLVELMISIKDTTDNSEITKIFLSKINDSKLNKGMDKKFIKFLRE